MSPKVKYLLFFFSCMSSILFAINDKKIDDDYKEIYKKHSSYEWVEALRLTEKNLNRSKKNNYKEGIEKGYLYKAKIYNILGYNNKALSVLDTFKKTYLDKSNHYMSCEFYRVQGNTYENIHHYDKALKSYYEQLNHSYHINPKDNIDILQRIWAYDNLISIYSYQSKTDSIWKYLNEKSSELGKLDEHKTNREYAYLYSDYASLFIKLKRYEEAYYYINKAEKKFLRDGKDPYIYHLYKVKGDYFFDLKEYQQALNNYKISLSFSTNVGADGDNDRILIYKNMSDIYFITSDSINAEKSLSLYKTALFNRETKNLEKEIEVVKQESSLIYIVLGLIVVLALFILYRKKSIKHNVISNDKMMYIIDLAKKNDHSFLINFKQVYPEFIENLNKKYPQLTRNEIIFCSYIYLEFTTKEMAEFTFVTNRAIQMRKNRLRKKLNIPSEIDLYKWIKEI